MKTFRTKYYQDRYDTKHVYAITRSGTYGGKCWMSTLNEWGICWWSDDEMEIIKAKRISAKKARSLGVPKTIPWMESAPY